MTKKDDKLGRGIHVPPDVGMDDFADDIHGNNRLQGNDQQSVPNQRQAVPGVRREADDSVLESFKKLDPDDTDRNPS